MRHFSLSDFVSSVSLAYSACSSRISSRNIATVLLIAGTLFSMILPSRLEAQNITLAPVITTFAGTGTAGYNGDNIAASGSQLYTPTGLAVDRNGNVYIVDTSNHRIRKVDSSGTITTIAGNGNEVYNGDNIPATSAALWSPVAVAVDVAGNVYIADNQQQRIRKVDVSGIITTVAGNGTLGYNGDNIPASSAELSYPAGVALDSAGNLYIADQENQRIRKVGVSGTITTVAGNGTGGYNGDNLVATSAELIVPNGVAVDGMGNLYIAEAGRIRKVDTTGTITTVAGTGSLGYNGDNIPAIFAELNNPTAVAVDAGGDIYIDDRYNNRVRKVDVNGTISTLAGDGTPSYNGDTLAAQTAELSDPFGVALDSDGNVYVANKNNERVRRLKSGPPNFGQFNVGASTTQNVFLSVNTALTFSAVQTSGDYSVLSSSCALNTLLAANTICTLQVQFTPAKPGQRWFPLVVTDSNSHIYSFALEGTGVGSTLAFTPGIISTVAGNGTDGYNGDGIVAVSAPLSSPQGVGIDSAGNLYIADYGNSRVFKVDTNGIITTVAGNGNFGYDGDNGPAISATLHGPRAVVPDGAGNVYFIDFFNQRVRKVDANGTISTVAGNGAAGYNGDNIAATSAELNNPLGVAVDSVGNLYIADYGNFRIRKVDTDGTITTVAGNGTAGYNGDNIAATSAELYYPYGLAVDPVSNLYIADSGNRRIRKVDANGTISTVAGNGAGGYNGDNIAATSAELYSPFGVALDSAGNLYIADFSTSRVRKVDPSGIITTIAGNGTSDYNGDNILATGAELFAPTGVVADGAGNVFIADSDNQRVRRVGVSTSTLGFGTVNVGQSSAPQTVTISNAGNAPLTISNIVTTSNFVVDPAMTSCFTLSPLTIGGSCLVQVTFAPTTAAVLTGTLTINYAPSAVIGNWQCSRRANDNDGFIKQ